MQRHQTGKNVDVTASPDVRARWREELVRSVRGTVRLDEPLGVHTTLGVGGPADVWLEPADVEDLSGALKIASKHEAPWEVLGAGSNVLVADGGFRGLIVHLPTDFYRVDVTTRKEMVRVSYSAGTSSSAAYRHAGDSGLVGLEFLAGIPGTLGGAVKMNAGTRLGEMADVVEGVEIVSAEGASWLDARQLEFAYRKAALPRGVIVTKVAILLRQAEPPTVEAMQARAKEELQWRRSSQPKGKSVGSMFKNPPRDHAGRLIEEAGLKGHRVGGAYVSDLHANFLMNDGSATARDIRELIEICRREVEARFGTRLHLEIDLIGGKDAE